MSFFAAMVKGIIVPIGIVGLIVLVLAMPSPRPPQQEYGVTFSRSYAESIGLDWKRTYQAILDDLGVRSIRLGAYWDEIEPKDGSFNFEELDFQMDLAAEEGASVILAIGRKLPRWPECYEPDWIQSYEEFQKHEQILRMLAVVVDRYKNHPALRMWQLENEPLLDYGECPPEDRNFLAREQEIVRSHDLNHKVLITDSGELNSWIPASAYGDILGTTMYRTVFSQRTQKLFQYDYIFPSWLYRLKARLVRIVRGKPVIISELQGEPWGVKPFTSMSKEERIQSFSPARFAQLHRFARRTQLSEAYWWGVEYWWWEKEKNNEPAYWDYARSIFDKEI